MSLLVSSSIDSLDTNNFKFKDIKTDYLDSEIDIHSFAKLIFDNKFTCDVAVSFREDIGKKTTISCENGKIILENIWNSEKPTLELIGETNKIFEFENRINVYSLEIENISNNINDNKNEASYPGINKKEILLNTKIIDNWMNEQK